MLDWWAKPLEPESAETRHCCFCHPNTVTLLYPCQKEALCLCRAHGCSSCFCHPITSCCPSLLYGNRTTSTTGKLKRVCLDTIASSLLITHVSLCAFTPLPPTDKHACSPLVLCWRESDGTKRLFWGCGRGGDPSGRKAAAADPEPEAHTAAENLWLRLQAGAGRVRF